MSFDDYFWKRRFTSTIYKEENSYDRFINEYRNGIDALIESRKINNEMQEFEHDVWNY